MVSTTIPYMSTSGRPLHCILRDYGAQNEFKLTHGAHLSCPASMYVIVLPLYDASNMSKLSPAPGHWNTIAVLKEHLVSWLRLIFAVMSSEGTVSQAPPIQVVVNMFAAYGEPPVELSTTNLDGMIEEVRVVFSADKAFHFMDTVYADARNKLEVYKLEVPIITASDLVLSTETQYSRYHCVDFAAKHCFWSETVLPEQDAVQELITMYKKYNYLSMKELWSTDEWRYVDEEMNALLSMDLAIKRVAEKCLEMLIEIHEFMVLKTNIIGQDAAQSQIMIITNPNEITNKVVGQVLHETADRAANGKQSSTKPALCFSSEELDAMVKGLPAGVTVSMILESLGLLIPVNVDLATNHIMPVTKYAESDCYLLGLIDVKMPADTRNACAFQHHSLRPVSDMLQNTNGSFFMLRSLSRLFCLHDKRSCFIPGFFTKLFIYLNNTTTNPIRSWFWQDGMALRSILRWKRRDVSSPHCHAPFRFVFTVFQETAMEGLKETLVYPWCHGDKEGFMVKINVWVERDLNTFGERISNWMDWFHPRDLMYDVLQGIRDFLHSKDHWQITLDEYVLGAGNPLLLNDDEAQWFGSESLRIAMREPLLGYFWDYDSLIASELDFEVALSRSAEVLPWRPLGDTRHLVMAIRKRIGDDETSPDVIKRLVIKYHQCNRKRLSVNACERLVRQVLGLEPAVNRDPITPGVKAENIPQPAEPTKGRGDAFEDQMLDMMGRVLEGHQQTHHALDEMLKRSVEKARGVHDFPLLAVRSSYSARGMAKLTSGLAGMAGVTTSRVHFLCCVCGCKSPTAGEGYLLSVGNEHTKQMFKVFHTSLSVLQVMLQLGGVPNQMSLIADLAIKSLDTLDMDIADGIADLPSAEAMADLRKKLVDILVANQDAPTGIEKSDGSNSILLDPSKQVSACSCPVSVVAYCLHVPG